VRLTKSRRFHARRFTLKRHKHAENTAGAALHPLSTFSSQTTKPNSHLQGLRTVATVEILKGLVAVAFAIFLLFFRDRDIGEMIANLLDILHVNPAHDYAEKLVRMGDRITPEKIEIVALIVFLYAIVRFVEGYGLWYAKTWAEYFAIISGAAYLPFEGLAFYHHPNWFHAVIILINVCVVLYVAYVRVAVHRERAREHAMLHS
jgi:uncharacterized membrane protein (DUF2068 family)